LKKIEDTEIDLLGEGDLAGGRISVPASKFNCCTEMEDGSEWSSSFLVREKAVKTVRKNYRVRVECVVLWNWWQRKREYMERKMGFSHGAYLIYIN